MKTVILLIITSALIFSPLSGQDVSDIRVERSGDLITIHYKISGSTSNQLFRVSILCSIGGSLKVQPQSITGDSGNNITGGREDYAIIWDVLKDVDEITTAEFFITAELTRDLSNIATMPVKKNTLKGKMLVMVPIIFPGPKTGLRVGYAGSLGFQAELSFGKITMLKEYQSTWGDQQKSYPIVGLDVTKRIINTKNFQAHLLAGFRSSDLYLIYTGSFDPALWRQGGHGAEAGLTFLAGKRLAFSLIYFQVKMNETDETEITLISPLNYGLISAGIRF